MANSSKGTAQVVPVTPKQKVAKQFGSKKELVQAIVALYDAPEGSATQLGQTSNTRLLSHHHNTKRLVAKFGSRANAVAAILKARFPKGNPPDSEQTKLAGYSPWRLMDLYRQATGETK